MWRGSRADAGRAVWRRQRHPKSQSNVKIAKTVHETNQASNNLGLFQMYSLWPPFWSNSLIYFFPFLKPRSICKPTSLTPDLWLWTLYSWDHFAWPSYRTMIGEPYFLHPIKQRIYCLYLVVRQVVHLLHRPNLRKAKLSYQTHT